MRKQGVGGRSGDEAHRQAFVTARVTRGLECLAFRQMAAQVALESHKMLGGQPSIDGTPRYAVGGERVLYDVAIFWSAPGEGTGAQHQRTGGRAHALPAAQRDAPQLFRRELVEQALVLVGCQPELAVGGADGRRSNGSGGTG